MNSQTAAALGGIAVVLLALDVLWLTLAMDSIFKSTLGDWVKSPIDKVPAALFYIVYVIGIYVFAVRPSMQADSPIFTALLYGAALGLVAYGAYDLTNLATLRAWTTKLAVIDMSWGVFLTAMSAAGGMYAAKLVK